MFISENTENIEYIDENVKTGRESQHAVQLDFLMHLGLIEQLQGFSRSPRITCPPQDDELIQILNWLSLCFVQNSLNDVIAVALSAVPSTITLHISSATGGPPTQTDYDILFLFMQTLRQVLMDDAHVSTVVRTFMRMLVKSAFPRIYRKIKMVAATTDSPVKTTQRFSNLISLWLRYRPEGETSRGMVNMAIAFAGGASGVNEILTKSFFNLVHQPPVDPRNMSLDEKYDYMSPILTACNLLVNSTFFDDLVHHRAFRSSLETADRAFLHKLLRRLSRVSCYKSGAAEFALRGIPYLRRVLGCDGMANFMHGMGGIEVNWVESHVPTPIKRYKWPYSPSVMVKRMLHRKISLGVLDFDAETLDLISHAEVIADAWHEGDNITPQYHCELQMINYLDEHHIEVMDHAIGTSKPMCWVCDRYINNLWSSPQWFMSPTSGKAHHEWLIPPGHPDVIAAVLKEVKKEADQIVENFAFECYP